jgi:hypothetical protein
VTWLLLGSAAGTPQLSSYLCYNGPGDTEATLLQWPSAGQAVSGTYRDAVITGTSPGEEVSTSSGALDGTITGLSVSLDWGGSGQVYGKLGTALILNIPQQDGSIQPVTCQAGTAAGWNRALSDLGTAVSRDNQAACRATQWPPTSARWTAM